MARPQKNNADYHSHDANMRNDIKIKALRRKYKLIGYAIYNMMLEVLTNAEYFEYEWSDFNVEILSGDFEIEPDLLVEIIDYCVNKINLFTIENGLIYSYQHQKRFESLLSKRKTDRNGVIGVDNTQSKVKYSKEEERKRKEKILFEIRLVSFENLEREIYEKLVNDYKITKPIIYTHKTEFPLKQYDLVEHLVGSITDKDWLLNLGHRFCDKNFKKGMIDYVNKLKTTYEYLDFKDTYDFRNYFGNWFNKNLEKYK